MFGHELRRVCDVVWAGGPREAHHARAGSAQPLPLPRPSGRKQRVRRARSAEQCGMGFRDTVIQHKKTVISADVVVIRHHRSSASRGVCMCVHACAAVFPI